MGLASEVHNSWVISFAFRACMAPPLEPSRCVTQRMELFGSVPLELTDINPPLSPILVLTVLLVTGFPSQGLALSTG